MEDEALYIQRVSASLVFTAVLGACAGYGDNAASPVKIIDGTLVAANGMTLYTFDRDSVGSGKSACNGPCANNWLPLVVKDNNMASSDYSLVTRDDGTRQLAYKGKSLYFWSKDQNPGSKSGDGFNNVLHAAKP